jgi:hypothetical protein
MIILIRIFMKKIIVTGGREYSDKEKVYSVLDHFNPDVVIHGDCRGADSLASNWVKDNNKKEIPYPYPSQYGKAGGPIRNEHMCSDHTDATLIAFPGGNGTASCIRIAKKLGLKVFEVV